MQYSSAAILLLLLSSAAYSQSPSPKTDAPRRFVATGDIFSIDLAAVGKERFVAREKVVRPNITSAVFLDGGTNLKVAIVYTKIRPDYPQGDEVLDTQKPRLAAMKGAYGEDFNLVDSTAGGRRSLTYTLDRETYNKIAFPFGVTQACDDDDGFSIGGHHFIVRNGYFLEIACVLSTETRGLELRQKEVLNVLKKITGSITFPKTGG